MAFRAPTTNEYVVLFESELFMFALLFSKAIAAVLQQVDSDREGYVSFSTDPKIIKNNLSKNQEPVHRFLEVLLAYLFTGRPSSAKPYFANQSIQALSQLLFNSMELFILGHEYGHVIKGHLSTDALHMTQLGKQEVSEITRSWKQEFEADVMGLQFMLHAKMKEGFDVSLSFWGADFFFSCIEVIYRSIAIFRGVEYSNWMSSSRSHPPPEMRREFIRKVLKNSLPDDASKGPIQLAQNIELITKILMESATPILLKMKQDGKQLYPTWQDI